jgi:MFS family permease
LTHQPGSISIQTKKPWIFYGYIIVAAAFLIQILTWGIYNSYGVFFTPLLRDFEWPRATIAGAVSLSQFLVGFGSIFLGNLNDRFGPRVLMIYVGVMVGIGYFLMSQVQSIWQLYLFQGLIIGIGISGTDVILLSTVARWFLKRRGMMSGIVKIGTGVGTMLAPLVITWLITEYEWRNTYSIIGITLFICIISSALLLRRDPVKMQLLPDGEKVVNIEDIELTESGYSLRQASKTRQFWLLCLAYFTVFFCTISIIVHFAPSVVEIGLSAAFGASMVSVIGGASIVGRFVMGITNDRIGSKRALLICFCIFVACFLWLQFVNQSWTLVIFAIIYGFCHGGFYTLVSPAVAEFFGIRSHGFIFGIVVFIGSIGGSLGPVIIGNMFDVFQSYQRSFMLLLVLACIGLISILLSGRSTSVNIESKG